LRQSAAIALLALASLAFGTDHARAGQCWTAPQPRTVEEALLVAQNKQAARRISAERPSAMLALSDGRLKAAYSAGLLVGWGETGRRPEFAVVTAVGTSALLAPFAFLGHDGDAALADLITCDVASLQDMADRAASYMTPNTIERIAQRHEAGARLLVAIPGSAARRETVWDIGAIAASRHREAHALIAAILTASVDLISFVDPEAMPVSAGQSVVRNPAFRRAGAGEAFLAAPAFRTSPIATYLIHNGVLFADEGEAFAAELALKPNPAHSDMWLLPAYELFSASQLKGARIVIASPRANLNIQPAQSVFDATYMRALFLYAFRQGRMGKEWRSTLVDTASR
jgi:hypothetical protein